MTARLCYFAREIADMLGLSVDAFYEQRGYLHSQGMPKSITRGRIRIPKLLFDTWFKDPNRRAEPAPANSNVLQMPASSDDDHRAHLQRTYGAR